MPQLPRLENVGVAEMTLDPPNELFERELNNLMKKLDKQKFDDQFHCDYHGKCKRRAYAEVYPENGSWSYLCFWHFIKERILGHFKMWCRASRGESNDQYA